MEPTYVDFSRSPAGTGNATVKIERGSARSGKLELDNGGTLRVVFTVPDGERHDQATLTVTGLVSTIGRAPGHAPLYVTLNDSPVIDRWTIPGGGDLPTPCAFAVPGDLLRPGANELCLTAAADARTRLWIYGVTLDPVWERGRSERAVAARTATEPVLRYDTRRGGVGASGWRAGRAVWVYVDRGEERLPAQLAWQDARGNEYAVTFEAGVNAFYGHCRMRGARPCEFRGSLTGRWRPDAAPGPAPARFDTWEGWGGGWHASNGITLLVGDGLRPLRRVAWRDVSGNNGTIGFDPDGGFVGTYQRVGEGPIGYRGEPSLKG